MSRAGRAHVIGAGFGGLSAALALACRGFEVTVFEGSGEVGGKAGTVTIDGVSLDTGPSLLTLPHVLAHLFELAGTSLEEHLELRPCDPAFRYHFADGTFLDVHHNVEDTIASVRDSLGSEAAADLATFLEYARTIWDASAPHFVFGDAPSVYSLMTRDFRALIQLPAIDAMTSMYEAICTRVRHPHLRQLLARYATYNGSDVRRCPGTLNCIAHVELALGGYGVTGGMQSISRALGQVCVDRGVRFELNTRIERLETSRKGVQALITDDGTRHATSVVVSNTNASHLYRDLLPPSLWNRPGADEPSMSAYNAVYRASGEQNRVAHSVFFPGDYMDEFSSIFDQNTVSAQPTIYACDQELTHGISGWEKAYPLFVMINAPAVTERRNDSAQWDRLQALVGTKLTEAGLIRSSDPIVWERCPGDLAARFPGSMGSIYGAASNGIFSAFRRPSNRVRGVNGLYMATGSAHPGGGVPLCLLSGLAAARAVLVDSKQADSALRVQAV